MGKILNFIYLITLSLVSFSQNKFPFRWNLYPCHEDVSHKLLINNVLINDKDEIANIGDTVIYEISFPKDKENAYEYSVQYDFFVMVGLKPRETFSKGLSDYSHVIKLPIIISEDIHSKLLHGEKSAKIYIEVFNFKFKDKTGKIGNMEDERISIGCCKTLWFYIQDSNSKIRKE